MDARYDAAVVDAFKIPIKDFICPGQNSIAFDVRAATVNREIFTAGVGVYNQWLLYPQRG